MNVGTLVHPNEHWYGGERSGYFGRVEATYESNTYGLCVLVNYGPNGPLQGGTLENPGRVDREWIPAACVDVADGVTAMLVERDGVL